MDRHCVQSVPPFVLAVVVCSLGWMGCVSSNGNGTPDAPASANSTTDQSDTSGPSASVTDAQLEEFARINEKIHQIRMETQKKLETAQSKQEAEKIRKDAFRQIQSVFQETDMSQQEYKNIGRRLKNDPELRRRLRKRLEGN